jgi:hypothetical protein
MVKRENRAEDKVENRGKNSASDTLRSRPKIEERTPKRIRKAALPQDVSAG